MANKPVKSAAGKVRGGRWMDEHVRDPYVQRAKAQGYRSRAAFKLLELDDRDKLLRPGQTVLDIGAAPGSWSQVARQRIGANGRIVAVDLLDIVPIAGVTFIQGDFSDVKILEAVRAALGSRSVDLVLSDMAPNISGIASADQARAEGLAELARDCALEMLKPGGAFAVKVFQSGGLHEFVRGLRAEFETVTLRKPDASRDRSSELFVVARLRRLTRQSKEVIPPRP